ncbi:MAG: hypothetical protein PF630_11195 [Gammaproteobacteria bacterium]|jgi:uncharacterized protein YbaR (Trm112 family)|nr:hypothetical protein [Gammaproteobacteria bacterium]
MTINDKLLSLLCDPVTHVPLTVIRKKQLQLLNRQIDAGVVETVDGIEVSEPLEDALITQDNKVIYPIRDGIPVLLYEQGIGTTQFDNFPS